MGGQGEQLDTGEKLFSKGGCQQPPNQPINQVNQPTNTPQEARGLDAGQRLVGRLVGAGDKRSASIVARISDEERAHVAVGVTWLRAVAGAQVRASVPVWAAGCVGQWDLQWRWASRGCAPLQGRRRGSEHALPA